ncbi:MAG: beta-ketoacyl-ACP synthase [Pseudomonadota bacterium]
MTTRQLIDPHGRSIVSVTGMGLTTSLGRGVEDTWRRLAAGDSGIRRIKRFETENLKTQIAGTVPEFDDDAKSLPERSEIIALQVAEEAAAAAALGIDGDFPGPLFLAMPPIEFEWTIRHDLAAKLNETEALDYIKLTTVADQAPEVYRHMFELASISETLAERFGTKGSPISLTTACASGATAIQLAVEALRRGEIEAALVVATDASVNPETMVRFNMLSALSTQNDPPEQASKPFCKNRDGFVISEGAAALVLETREHALARGATELGVLAGVGDKADGFHRTRSNPDGKSIIAAMQNALSDAGVTPDDIDHINAHGTSTPENDKMESFGAAAVFGERAAHIPLTSNKSMIGHTISAAGAIEAVVTLKTLAEGRIPPTINYDLPDPAIELDVVGNTARDANMQVALSSSFGFGGQNTCLVAAREPLA